MNEALDIAIINLCQVVCVGKDQPFKKGPDLHNLNLIETGDIGIKNGRIVFVGKGLPEKGRIDDTTRIIDGRGCIALPGFVDPHTHLIFSGTREHELEMKLLGHSYMEILKAGGGILYTVKRTRNASLDDLMDEASQRLDRMLLHGTTTAEAKSGYGLDTETELRSLKVISLLNSSHPVDLIPTFLGAHALPPEYNSHEDYVDHVITDMLPRIVREGLAHYCDVFLEKGVFEVNESRRLLSAARDLGLLLKLHVDEIENLGGTDLACELGAVSAEHLVKTTSRQIRELAENRIACIFLPGTPFSLMDGHYPAAKEFIDEGCIVSLATDLNPNCMCVNIQFILSLAVYNMGMTPAQVISASTLNAAFSIGKQDEIGSIEVGKRADISVLDLDDYRKLPYQFGVNHIRHVIKNGNIEVFNGKLVNRERSVYIYAFKDDCLLLVKSRKRKGWEVPGGKMKPGESIEETALREFMEETGHDLQIVKTAGKVVYGRVGKMKGDFDKEEIEKIGLFHKLPDALNFPKSEFIAFIKASPKDITPDWIYGR